VDVSIHYAWSIRQETTQAVVMLQHNEGRRLSVAGAVRVVRYGRTVSAGGRADKNRGGTIIPLAPVAEKSSAPFTTAACRRGDKPRREVEVKIPPFTDPLSLRPIYSLYSLRCV
jgi:hypothetical protein